VCRRTVSCGNQNEVKGIDLLINAFAAANRTKQDHLVLTGPASKKVKAAVDRYNHSTAGNRIILIDRFVSETEFQCSLLAADIVAVPYRKANRPSGIICRCLAWGIPIVGTDHGWPKWACERVGGGWITNIHDTEQFGSTLMTSLDQSPDFIQSPSAAAFAQFNTLKNYQDFWCFGFESRRQNTAGYIRLDQLTGTAFLKKLPLSIRSSHITGRRLCNAWLIIPITIS